MAAMSMSHTPIQATLSHPPPSAPWRSPSRMEAMRVPLTDGSAKSS